MTRIRSRLFISFAIVVGLFAASALFSIVLNSRGIATTESVRRDALPRASRMEEIALSITSIQRWMLDAALTGDSFGLDRADQIFADVRQLIQNLEQETEGEQLTQLNDMQLLFEEMFNAGLEMTAAFNAGDEDEGFYLLEDFGAIAEEASDLVENLRSESFDAVALGAFDIHNNLKFVNRISLIAILVSIVLSSLFALFSTSRISRPIEKLSTTALALANGNLIQSIPTSQLIEIRHLGSAIHQLIESLSHIIGRIQDISSEVTRDSEEVQNGLVAAATETQAAMVEIGSNLESIRGQTGSLESMINGLISSSEQISSTAESLENQVERQASVITQSSASVEQMIRSIDNVTRTTRNRSESARALQDVLETGRTKLTASTRAAEKLTESVEQMNIITKLISDVNGKSSLLSMNAAIEAAHAGKQGLGFAVVAGEMRKLSEDTAGNAIQIRDIINQAITQIQDLTDETSQANDAFNAIGTEVEKVISALVEITHTMEEMSAGSAEIASAVSLLTEVSSEVSEATNNMKTVSRDVGEHIASTEEISVQVQQAVSEIGMGTREVQASMNSIFDRVREMVASIEAIHDSVDHYTISRTEEQMEDGGNPSDQDRYSCDPPEQLRLKSGPGEDLRSPSDSNRAPISYTTLE